MNENENVGYVPTQFGTLIKGDKVWTIDEGVVTVRTVDHITINSDEGFNTISFDEAGNDVLYVSAENLTKVVIETNNNHKKHYANHDAFIAGCIDFQRQYERLKQAMKYQYRLSIGEEDIAEVCLMELNAGIDPRTNEIMDCKVEFPYQTVTNKVEDMGTGLGIEMFRETLKPEEQRPIQFLLERAFQIKNLYSKRFSEGHITVDSQGNISLGGVKTLN